MERSTWRILDVNANRAMEGLRTIEDAARVIREDAKIADSLKSLRHDLAAVIEQLDRSQRLMARDTAQDAGIGLTAASERQRVDWRSIVVAASERCQQSLRCLEEYSKLISEDVSLLFKSLRYRAYDVLAEAELRLLSTPFPSSAQLYLLVNCSLPLAEFQVYVRSLADSGADLIQLRDKSADGARLRLYAGAATQALAETSTRLIVNDRVDIALASGAAGVHLGQEDLPIQDARRIAGYALWIGVSTHSIERAIQAQASGADYIGCGPTFSSTTKAFDEFPGPKFVAEVSARITIPFFAIGGITEANLSEVKRAGCSRIAVSSVVQDSAHPQATVQRLKRHLQSPTA
jgi:thiamine-phosphate pyrophosphorylase